MDRYNPPHPGEFIRNIYLEPQKLSYRSTALKLGVSASTFQRLIQARSNISATMALRLSKTLGRTAESWLAMQAHYDLWQAKQTLDIGQVQKLTVA